MRKKILIIGMLDSIHVGRWLGQFKEQEIDFVLFPSKKFRKLHPLLSELVSGNSVAKFMLSNLLIPKSLLGYFDYLLFVVPQKIFRIQARSARIASVIQKHDFKLIHALEIQGAGYELDLAISKTTKEVPGIIITNWGSDIYFFGNNSTHEKKIRSILSKATFYSAECSRDYILAKKMGFKGVDLPCIPNAGGFSPEQLSRPRSRASVRSQIVIKSYGGTFGLGNFGIQLALNLLKSNSDYKFFFYSVTPDLLSEIKNLQAKFPEKIRFSTIYKPLTRSELEVVFEESRIYVGCSRSDGISTAFLEAMVTGAYPIQTNTSCANEWISKGAIGSIIKPDLESLFVAVQEATDSDTLVDLAQEANQVVSKIFLNACDLEIVAKTFY